VIGQLLWQPFDVRYGNLLQRLERHNEILKLEINIMTFKMQTYIPHFLSLFTNDEATKLRDSFPNVDKIVRQVETFELKMETQVQAISDLALDMKKVFEDSHKGSLW
jgi:t-SNARE complex subunit (syntaxin)